MRKLTVTNLMEHPKFLQACGLVEVPFLYATCEVLRDVCAANTVFIASFGLVEADYLIIEAHSSGGEDLEEKHFYASKSPCIEAINEHAPVCISRDVDTLYPDAKVLTLLKTQACVGLPLHDTEFRPIGTLVLEWSEAVDPDSLQQVVNAVTPFLGRIVEELRRKSLAHVIPTLVSPITPWSQNDATKVFRDIAEQAARLTNVNSVAIVHRTGEGAGKFRILAITCGTEDVQDTQGTLVDYSGIPCFNMLTNDVFFLQSGVRDSYPGMDLLERLDVEAYLGVGFRNTTGETIGHIAFLHNRPMRPSVTESNVISVIAARAGQELHRYTLEREKEASDKALRVRSKLESLGTMSGTIAHDFNNQLTSMIGNTQLASLAVSADHPAREFLENAEESMWRARDVITEIMDFAGNPKGAPLERVALGEAVTRAVNEFTPRLHGNSHITTEIAPDLPDVLSRRMQIVQILTNLITNGLDALNTRQDNSLTVRVDLVRLGASERDMCLTGKSSQLPPRCLRVRLIDKGRGMDADTMERIFDPYFSTKGVSRGLGLSSVLGIAKRLGIGLTCMSEVGAGTVFQLFFAPLDKDRAENSPKAERPLPQVKPAQQTVLVVDDDARVNTVVSKMLELWGWRVITAHSGEEALRIARATPDLDFAIVDVVMAGMSGIETLKAVRKFMPKLPALIISGYSEDNSFSEFDSDKDVLFLVKPFGAQALKAMIDKLLS